MKKHKGSILLFALIVLSFILIAAFSVASVTLIERRSANISVNSSTAFQNADKGMEEFLQQLYKDLDQGATLDDMAEALDDLYVGEDYACEPSSDDSIPAYIGNNDTTFIISAFKENIIAAGDSGWDWDQNELVPIMDCDRTTLAEVSRFRVAGNYNTAVRAVFVKLRDSLTRGLVARWAFEDRANNERLATDDDSESKTSYVALDTSKNRHTLTLCDIRSDSPVDVIVDPEYADGKLEIDEFSGCEFDSVAGMIPKKQEDDCDDGDGDDCHTQGSWVDGIVEETFDSGGSQGTSKEAIAFYGAQYLKFNVDNGCDYEDQLNCTTEKDDKIANIEKGIAISLWVNIENENTAGTLVSRRDGNDGFEVRIDNTGKVVFQLNGQEAETSGDIDDGDWHHIVAQWPKREAGGGGDDMQIFIDGADDTDPASDSFSGTISGLDGIDLVVGADSDGANYFTGVIDDLRIWDRPLAEPSEICRLCTEATPGTHGCSACP